MTNNRTISVIKEWGSHGYSHHGVYWIQWKDQETIQMTETEFDLAVEGNEVDTRADQREMRNGDSSPIFAFKRQSLTKVSWHVPEDETPRNDGTFFGR